MKIPSYLQRNRYGKYYFRRAVPAHLRAIIGKREIVRSLRVNNFKHAVRISRVLTILFDKLIKDTEKAMNQETNIRTYYSYSVTDHPDGRKELTQSMEPDAIRAMAESLSASQMTDVLKSFNNMASSIPQPDDSAWAAPSSGINLAELIKKFTQNRIDERGGSWKPAKTDGTKLRRLAEVIGAECPISGIDIDSAERVRCELSKLPANPKQFRGLTVTQANAATKGQDIVRLSNKTVNDHLELYSRLFTYARNRNHIQLNPFEEIRVRQTSKQRAKDKRDLFTTDDLGKIFSTKHFTTIDYDRPYRYWAPLIALFSGARRAEIASLYVDDVRQVNDIWVLDINENGTGKRVKTANGIRRTPIHPMLIKLGLLEYVDSLIQQGEERLFPELNWTEKEGYGRAIGDWFTEHLRSVGIYQRNKKVFHSFRHTLTTALHRSGADSMTIEQICGRSTGGKSVGELVYVKDDALSTLHKAVSKLDFSGALKNVSPFFPDIASEQASS